MKEAILYLSTLFLQLQKKGDVLMLDELKCIMLLSIEAGIQPLASNQSEIATNFPHISFTEGDITKAMSFLKGKNFILEEDQHFRLTAKGNEVVKRIKKARDFM